MNERAEAVTFYNEGMQQLDRLVHGEYAAKTGLLVATLLRRNIVFAGPAGGGKSTLAQDSWRLIDGANEQNVVHLLGQHDMTASQFVGSDIVTAHAEETQGVSTTKSSVISVEGLIKPNTMWVDFDEINLANPHAVQSLLPVLENRELRTTAGVQPMKDLRTITATLNPTDSNREVSYRMTERMASRFALGAMVGEDATASQETRIARVAAIRRFHRDGHGNAEAIQPIINAAQLDNLREYALSRPIPSEVSSLADQLSIRTVDALATAGINEDSARLSIQMEDIAKVLGVFNAEDGLVAHNELVRAVGYIVTARMAILRKKTPGQVNAIVHNIAA